MNLHQVVASLIEAQNSFDSQAYADCFTETAIVHDEGKTHKGKAEIQQWIENSNREYQAVLKPLRYEETGAERLLIGEVSGTFPGSPAILKFHLRLEADLIQSLTITG
ncbi:nuclear transport factor 2 family protein [Desertivirga xinjiangensis]|uniref:nuclear transport factor 2 family protein n=1 Tax=Desertivirga xinjiangensis TaxID=539206 RepID=UPI00210C5BBC|nr:nuclear transport factor 2 family protein [Pedobacter xinjiangensis]